MANPFRRRSKSVPSVVASVRLVELLRAWNGAVGSYAQVYRQLPPVRTVVDFLADAVSTTPIKVHVRQDNGRPEVRGHPLARTLRHPNPELSTRGLLAGTVKDVGIYGNAYWEIVEDTSAPAGLWLVPQPPARVIPKGGDVMAAAVYEIWPVSIDSVVPSSTPRRVGARNMVHFRLYDPEDRRVGTSKIEAVRQILAEEIEASRQREAFWKNAARREGVIERPADAPTWTDQERKLFREDWQARHSGPGGGGLAPVLEDGMSWNPDTFSPKESEFLEGRKFVLEAVARVYNVPLPLLSLTETATFASQKEFHRQLYQDTLPPWYELLQSEIELQLLPWFDTSADPDVYVEFAVESKLRGSFEEQAGVLKDAIGRPWMTVEEGRQLFNMPDRGDATDKELAVPVNNVVLGAPEPGAAAPAPAALPPAAPSSQVVAGKALGLKEALDRQQRAVLSRVGAGAPFDAERWNRELGELVAAHTEEVAT